MAPDSLRLNAVVRIPANVNFQNLNDELVILDLESGKYFGLDPVGARIWTLIGEHGSLIKVLGAMLEEYNASQEQLERDLLKLVEELAAQKLVVIDPNHEADTTNL